jgi:pimeloyl-ACP methyl ester carboxylesterase
MTTFVLVPGMWHGGWSYKKLAPLLQAGDHEAYAVTLTGLGERAHLRYSDIDMNTHIQDVINVLEYEDLQKVVLVSHSLGGIMVPGVADRVPARISHIVNLDGPIPEDGKSTKEMLPDFWAQVRQHAKANGDEWWAPPFPDWTFGVTGDDLEWMKARLTAHPLRTWETPFSLGNPAARAIPRTFIQCTEDVPHQEVEGMKNQCIEKRWQYRALSTGHDAMITAPHELTQLLVDLI